MYDRLIENGHECVELPPHLTTEPKVSRVKTDKRDARRLTKMLENGDFRGCHAPDKEIREDSMMDRWVAGATYRSILFAEAILYRGREPGGGPPRLRNAPNLFLAI